MAKNDLSSTVDKTTEMMLKMRLYYLHMYTTKQRVLGLCHREKWGSQYPRSNKAPLTTPAKYVIVNQVNTRSVSYSDEENRTLMRRQRYQDVYWHGLDDIAYNFYIGNNGMPFEGRGWDVYGHQTDEAYVDNNITISFMGRYNKKQPSRAQCFTVEEILQCGVETKKIDKDYELKAQARAGMKDYVNGRKLYYDIKLWRYYSHGP